MFKRLKDTIQGKSKKGKRRSNKWSNVRKQHLKHNPRCVVCGSKHKIEVHHIIPFSAAPELELEPSNFITLCENKKYGINCHLLIGHLGNYRNPNPKCLIDAAVWHNKLKVNKK